MSLYEELKRYVTSGVVPMHMPGHKRNIKFYMENPYSIDITEVDEIVSRSRQHMHRLNFVT